MSRLAAVDRVVARWERRLAVLLVAAVVTIVALQVFFRYVLNSSLGWSEEAARYLFMWAAVLGFSSAVEAKRLFSFELLATNLPPAGKRICTALFVLAATLFLWVLVVDGGALVLRTLTQTSPAIGIPMAVPYAALPVGAVLIALHLIARKAQ